MADFGNSYYNDHHYHWGYFIQTGAIIAHLDSYYIPKMKSWVEGLIRDANNPSTADTNFPQFRYFDWYSGHSWSQVRDQICFLSYMKIYLCRAYLNQRTARIKNQHLKKLISIMVWPYGV